MDLTWYRNILIILTFLTRKICGKPFPKTAFPCTDYRNCTFPDQYCDDLICRSCQSTCKNPESLRPPGCITFCTQTGRKEISRTGETEKVKIFPNETKPGIVNEEPNGGNNQHLIIGGAIIGGAIVLMLLIILLVCCRRLQQSNSQCTENIKHALSCNRQCKIIRCDKTPETVQEQDNSHSSFLPSAINHHHSTDML